MLPDSIRQAVLSSASWLVRVASVWVLVLAGCLSGCGSGVDGPGFMVHNATGEALGHLVITDAGPVLNYNNLEDGEKLTRGIPKADALPRTVSVHWEDQDGRHHQQLVELWKHLPSSYAGTVKLTLGRNGGIRVSKA